MNHVLESQKFTLKLNKMITARREKILYNQNDEEKFLREILHEVQNLDAELYTLKSVMIQSSSSMKRRFEQSTVDSTQEESIIESTNHG